MEDQSTDTSDLTDNSAEGGVKKPARSGVPVGKRGGKHRYFRPRPVTATPEEATAESIEAESSTAVEPSTVEGEDTPIESAPKAKRRRWFHRRTAAAPADAMTEAEAPEESTAPGETEEPDDAVADYPADIAEEPAAPKPVGRRMAIAVAVAATLFVAAGAFGGAMLQPYLADRAAADTRMHVAQTATAAITTLFTYTPDDMDQLAARSAKYLGGELKDAYTKQVDALAATNKQNQIHRSAQVVGTAVESVDGPNATAMVYANVTYTSAATKDVPKIFLVSYRLTMQRKGSDWVITNMPWITSKDLTRVTP